MAGSGPLRFTLKAIGPERNRGRRARTAHHPESRTAEEVRGWFHHQSTTTASLPPVHRTDCTVPPLKKCAKKPPAHCIWYVCPVTGEYAMMIGVPWVRGGRPVQAVNPDGLVVLRVVTAGKWVANDHLFGMTPRNCVSAARIAPAWPAFAIDKNAAAMVRDHYGTDDVHTLDDWDWKPLVALWQRLRSAAGQD
jgi:hypothetical protein